MPCDTIQRSSVNLELKADNKQYLLAALKSLGYSVSESRGVVSFTTPDGTIGQFVNGQLKVSGYYGAAERFNVNPIKRAYSTEVVKSAAVEFGWEIQETSAHTFDVQKESY